MRKLLIISLALLLLGPLSAVFADTEIYTNAEIVKRRKLIQKVGYQILNANRIEERMNFEYAHQRKEINAYSKGSDRTIVVTKGMMNTVDSEDELAAVLGHEISHSIDSYRGIFKGYFSNFVWLPTARRNETRADLRSIDFMVNAGYNPVAALIVYNKILSQPRYEWYSSHPVGSKRMAKMYERIFQKYPYFLVNNEYIKNPIYQNFLLNSKKNRLEFKEALEEAKNTNKKFKQPSYN